MATRRINSKRIVEKFIIHSFLCLVSVSCLFPLLWMLSTSLKSQSEVFLNMSLIPSSFKWNNYIIAWKQARFGTYFFNSLIYTTTAVTGVLLFASLAAYAFARFQFRGRNLLFYLFLASMMIPIPGAFIPLYILLIRLQLVDTRIGLILPYINAGLPLAIFILKGFFEGVPRDLEDAARIDGCSRMGIYWRIMLPLATPALATVAIISSLTIWNEYLLALIVVRKEELLPIQVGLWTFQGQHITNYPLLMAGLTIAALPLIIIYMIMQKNIIKGITAGALKA
ncbi:carbohydrate ABC transporter permease [bacterium]|nr:carbohydrate ABC transporter permease [bacterium]MBU1852849.1 carbohydrate ABC transporter permease [Candidatus Omnitrophota bacterium]